MWQRALDESLPGTSTVALLSVGELAARGLNGQVLAVPPRRCVTVSRGGVGP